MIFKTALLLGLLAGCYAAPIRTSKATSLPRPATGSLGRRVSGTIPYSVKCGEVIIYSQKIEAALKASLKSGKSGDKKYPTYFGNKNKNGGDVLKHDGIIE
jgi:hypothetical protein